MGVYGMLAMAFFVFVARCFIPRDRESERAMKVSFWSLNVGLASMMFVNLVPSGMFQLFDSFQNGYWHARAPEFFLPPEIPEHWVAASVGRSHLYRRRDLPDRLPCPAHVSREGANSDRTLGWQRRDVHAIADV